MPNFKQHLMISAVASGVTYFAMCRYYGRPANFGEFLTCEGAGVFSGAAPDLIEPAINPNHRALGHSVTLGAGLAKIAVDKCDRENSDWRQFSKILVAVIVVCYLAHLIADGLTPKGLPLLGR